jgi:hypothetical protein
MKFKNSKKKKFTLVEAMYLAIRYSGERCIYEGVLRLKKENVKCIKHNETFQLAVEFYVKTTNTPSEKALNQISRRYSMACGCL